MAHSSRSHKYNFTWPIVICLIIGIVAAAAYLNLKHTDESALKVVNSLDIDNGDQEINWNQYPTRNITLNSSYQITQSGTYRFTGTLSDGSISIATGVDSKVRLVLDDASIANSNGPAIYCSSGDELVIELIGENSIIDGETYSGYDEDVTGAIYSKADLTFGGEGKLNIIANYSDSIVGKDDVKFNSGTYNIVATDDAIRGKDSVYIVNGNFIIEAGADGIKSTNEVDVGKGFVIVENGNLNLTTGAKGIKATRNLVLHNGDFAIKSTDDALHCDNYIGIINGTYHINSGDDGIHANKELIVNGGSITIAQGYEGLEAQIITINNGNINLKTSDDGINAGGGADGSATTTAGRMGAGPFDADANCILSINGGTLYINAAGDGIDSNGWLYFNGGTTIVDGPANNGNSSLDSGMGIIINGGEVLALGSTGMAETLGSTSSINNISVYFDTTYPAGTTIAILNDVNETIFTHTSAKSFSHLTAGSPSFILGATYTIYINEERLESFTVSGVTTILGKTNTNQQTMPNKRKQQ